MIDNQKKGQFYTRLGNKNFDKSKYDRAIQNYRKALLIDTSISDLYYKLANSYSQLNNPNKHQKQAIRLFQRAIAIDPNNT